MKAVILAAGMGSRLRPLTYTTPKCLIRVNGKPILQNALEHLSFNGITAAVIVIGHLGKKVRDFIGDEFHNVGLTYVENKNFRITNNIYSLWLAKEYLNDDIILLEDDIFFEHAVLERLCNHNYPNVIVTDLYHSFMDGTGINVENNIVTEIVLKENDSRKATCSPSLKTVNIYKFSRQFMEAHMIRSLDEAIAEGHHDVFYEFALSKIVKSRTVRLVVLQIAGLKWFEIDKPEDLREAERLFKK